MNTENDPYQWPAIGEAPSVPLQSSMGDRDGEEGSTHQRALRVDSGVAQCRHCGARIVRENFALGAQWMHQIQEASGMDRQHWFCHKTVAGPPNTEKDATDD